MIEVRYKKDKGSYEIHLKGHADYNPGNDIVCAAASNLIYTLAAAVANIHDTLITTEVMIGKGDTKVKTTIKCEDIRSKVATMYETILIGYWQLEANYKANVRVTIEGE